MEKHQQSEYVNVERIEFIVTYRCNSHCRHCAIGSYKRRAEPIAIDDKLALNIVSGITGEYTPNSIMTFGGEPLLFHNTVCAIHGAAKLHGIVSREIITNAGWPRSEAEFREVAFRLAESGVTKIAISVDSFHQQYIPLDVVERNVKSLKDAGIPELGWNPCWVVSREHDNPLNRRTREILGQLEHLDVPESFGNNVQPSGNALIYLREYMPSKVSDPAGSCEDVPYAQRLDKVSNISVEPDGTITVCKDLVVGNAKTREINKILRSYNPYAIPEIAAILRGGMSQLIELAQTQGVEPDPDGYYSICDMCISLRRNMAKASSM